MVSKHFSRQIVFSRTHKECLPFSSISLCEPFCSFKALFKVDYMFKDFSRESTIFKLGKQSYELH